MFPGSAAQRSSALPAFRSAFILIALASVIHFGALFGQWAWLQFAEWRLSHALIAQASSAGIAEAATASAAFLAISRRHDAALHRAPHPGHDAA